MERLKFEGDTLGQRHRNYNILFQEIITEQSNNKLTDIDSNVDDVENLFKIDMASRTRNLEYILGVLKGNDMLYVSRVIRQCPWLITDEQYTHIINPEHLNSQLFPQMMAKATNKLMLHIRLNLREEARVESFFNYYENVNSLTALKWLPHCSSGFIETKVEKYARDISTHLLKRLCEKNHNVLKLYINHSSHLKYSLRPKLQATMFLLNTHTNFYLDVVEAIDKQDVPKFNSKCTHFIMKTCPDRIFQNIEKYARKIDIPTFVKFLPPNKIGDFLLKQVRNENEAYNGWINYHKLQYFIQKMPHEQRFGFITDVFISKNFDQAKKDFENLTKAALYRSVTHNGRDYMESYHWYRFAPFDVAFREIKGTTTTKNNYGQNKMLDCLIEIVSREPQHIDELLHYYHNNHGGDVCREKYEFARSLCTRTNVLKYNKTSWNLYNKIYETTCLIKEECTECFNFEKENQTCVQAVVIYKVINNEEIPEIIMNKLEFNILKEYQKQLNSEEKSKLFDFLYDRIQKRIDKSNFADHTLIDANVALINSMLTLLNNWNKNLADFSYVRNKIKEIINVKKDGLSWIYNVNKTWRKCLFEESIVLCPSEKTCMNALKHDPSLLSRNEKEVSALQSNDTVFLRQMLCKLKIYWPQSLALEWAQAYRGRLEEPLGHKALMRGLSFLLPQCELIKIISRLMPRRGK